MRKPIAVLVCSIFLLLFGTSMGFAIRIECGFCDTHNNNSFVDGVSTKANIQSPFNTLQTKMNSNDSLFCNALGTQGILV